MTRSRSMLWLSLVLLLVGSVLMEPNLLVNRPGRTAQSAVSATGRLVPPGSRTSASRIEPGATGVAPNSTWEESPQRLDLRGNEIARPVARYRVDDQGSLYEVHSPDTEVARLKAPVM